mgnify:CR=1 FL=1
MKTLPLLVPTFSFEHEAIEIRLTVFDSRDARHGIRTTAAGKNLERASITAVEALVASER